MMRRTLAVLAMLVALLGAGDAHARSEEAIKRNNFGADLLKQGRLDEAIGAFEQALKIDPSNATVQGNLANSRKNKAIVQEREARIADARKQVEAQPKDPRAAYNLARVYAALDMKEQAFEWLGKALQLGFDDIRFVREDPTLAGLKNDPRFARLLEGR